MNIIENAIIKLNKATIFHPIISLALGLSLPTYVIATISPEMIKMTTSFKLCNICILGSLKGLSPMTYPAIIKL
jgi:hypothetical protein